MNYLRTQIVAAVLISLLTSCGLTPVKPNSETDRQYRGTRDTIILFGGVGFIDETAQPHLYRLLTDKTYRLEDATDEWVSQTNQAGTGFKNLSIYPIALDLSGAEDIVAQSLHPAAAPVDATAHLENYFNQLLGLFLIGSYEQHMGLTYQYPLSDGREGTSFHDYFFTSVSAVLMDLKTDRIVLSASALGHERRQAAATPVQSDSEKQQYFLNAYNNAAQAALGRLGQLLNTHDVNNSAAQQQHMVTGVWINGEKAQQQFQWQHPGQSQNMCEVPSGCRENSSSCAQFSSLLAHGITDALSARGLATLPPLNWSQWRSDNAWEVSARFSLPENRKSLTDRLIDFSLDPKQTTHKYVAVVDDIDFSSAINPKNAAWVTDHYVTNLSLIRARTPINSCDAQNGIEHLDGKKFYGTYQSHHSSGRAQTHPDTQRMFYLIALMNALEHIPQEVR